ncbi:hypothetical protein [Gluconobacter cerinus]|uniref:hypothetical protein n=1 Tax=Gluconobacter cerinus TaxID=38307 RepID=UPI001B8C98A2|nr:hypothetical protein [Gluconobacter cerinus]MBS1038070.1 hypothetical protein [Gluconobacter cerinus]
MADRYAILHTDANEGYYEGFVIPSGEDLKEASLEKAKESISHIHKQIDAGSMPAENYNAMINDTNAYVYVLSPEYIEEFKDELKDLLNAEPDKFVDFDNTFPGNENEAMKQADFFHFEPMQLDFERRETVEDMADDLAEKLNEECKHLFISSERIKNENFPGEYNVVINVDYHDRKQYYYDKNEHNVGSIAFDGEDDAEAIEEEVILMETALKEYNKLATKTGSEDLKDIDISIQPGEPVKFTIENNDGEKTEQTASSLEELKSVVSEIKTNFLNETQTSGMKM